ncbi:hypothetical protein MW7_007165 [Imbroritus primus]|uniref:Uncharacterized protein n=1 Tax=Imbroritus primus TaxID=3058603 RepID=A0ACD3SQI5_9BURK|nr:hypothetical protein MW7_007165 [Burkholderiaceae bacterium PBA]
MSKRIKRGRPARETGAMPSLFRFSRNAELSLQLIPHSELEKLRDGTANEESWHTLAFRINVGAMLAAMYFAQDAQDAMTAAVAAVASVGKRYTATGRLGMSGDEFRAIGAGLNLTDEMQTTTTKRQQYLATRAVYSKATAGGRVKVGEMIDIMEAV